LIPKNNGEFYLIRVLLCQGQRACQSGGQREKRVTSASLLPSIRQNDYSITIEVLVELVKQLVVMGILEVITTFYLRPVIPQSDFLIPADKDYAFPSGHAVIVSAGATGALMLFRGTPRRVVVSTIFAIEAALVCLSRIYVGGHYPLDVIGGILLGVGVSLIFVGVEKYLESLFMPLKKLLRR
jgi:membrane-associated phospholipid phosphatase